MALRLLGQNVMKTNIKNVLFSKSSIGLPTACSSYPMMVNSVSALHTSQRNSNSENKSLTIWKSVREIKSSPMPALVISLSGLVPFVAAPAYMLCEGVFSSSIALVQLAYGASILSFAGGVRWGFTLPEDNPVQPNWVNLGYSVTPPLIACTALLLPATPGCITLMFGIAGAAYFDMAMYGYPAWFKGLRFIFSLIAILSLWTVVTCRMLLFNEKKNEEKNQSTQQENDSIE